MIDKKHVNTAAYPYKWFYYDCIWEGDRIIFPDANCNAICETDVRTGSTQIIGTADEEEERLLFYGIYKWRDYLLLPGRNAKPGLHVFHMTDGEWSYIAVEDSKKEWMNFREEGGFEYNGYLYIFPMALVVLKVDIEKRSIDYIFYPDMEPKEDSRGEVIRIDDTVYVPLKHGVTIYKFDLASEQWEVTEVNTDLKGIDTLCYDGRLFWLSGVGRMICSWDEKNNTSVSYQVFPQGFCKLGSIDECAMRKGEDGWWFGRSFLYGKSIYFLPNDANMLVMFDLEKKEMEEIPIAGEEETKESLAQRGRFSTIKYMGAKQRENLLLMLSNKKKNLILLDLETKETQTVELAICAESELGKIVSSRRKINEGVVGLNVWLNYMSGGERQGGDQKGNELMGQRIYNVIGETARG